jgi:hypothetical protein
MGTQIADRNRGSAGSWGNWSLKQETKNEMVSNFNGVRQSTDRAIHVVDLRDGCSIQHFCPQIYLEGVSAINKSGGFHWRPYLDDACSGLFDRCAAIVVVIFFVDAHLAMAEYKQEGFRLAVATIEIILYTTVALICASLAAVAWLVSMGNRSRQPSG